MMFTVLKDCKQNLLLVKLFEKMSDEEKTWNVKNEFKITKEQSKTTGKYIDPQPIASELNFAICYVSST